MIHTFTGDKLPLHGPCMEGTRNDILTKIEREVKSVDSPNVNWIRGFPGIRKSVPKASIATTTAGTAPTCDMVLVRQDTNCDHHYRCPVMIKDTITRLQHREV